MKARAFFFQVITFVLVIGLFYTAIGNLFQNIEARGIQTGFSFLNNRAGFDILPFLGNIVVDYTPESSNLTVFYVGLVTYSSCCLYWHNSIDTNWAVNWYCKTF